MKYWSGKGDRTRELLGGVDGIPLSFEAMPVSATIEGYAESLGITKSQWRRLRPSTRQKLLEGAARIEQLQISEPLRFATARGGDRNER
jgi:hypothetical protein